MHTFNKLRISSAAGLALFLFFLFLNKSGLKEACFSYFAILDYYEERWWWQFWWCCFHENNLLWQNLCHNRLAHGGRECGFRIISCKQNNVYKNSISWSAGELLEVAFVWTVCVCFFTLASRFFDTHWNKTLVQISTNAYLKTCFMCVNCFSRKILDSHRMFLIFFFLSSSGTFKNIRLGRCFVRIDVFYFTSSATKYWLSDFNANKTI